MNIVDDDDQTVVVEKCLRATAWLSHYIVIKISKNTNLLLNLESKSLMKTFINI